MADQKNPMEDFLKDLSKETEKKSQIDGLMLGIGSLAEISAITMKSFMRNGFTRDEALEVVKTMISTTFSNMLGPK